MLSLGGAELVVQLIDKVGESFIPISSHHGMFKANGGAALLIPLLRLLGNLFGGSDAIVLRVVETNGLMMRLWQLLACPDPAVQKVCLPVLSLSSPLCV